MPGCEKDNNDRHSDVDYEIAVNGSFKIELISNPTTGYMWAWTNKTAVTTLDTFNREYIPDTPDRVGSGGKEIWYFRGIKRGTDIIIMEYCRSWKPNSTIDSAVIKVRVD